MSLPAYWAALPWAAPLLAFVRLSRQRPTLADAPLASGRLVSIIVPARNEQDNLPILLDSLLLTRYDPIEILVVNDRSTDGTAAVVRGYADRHPRVRLVEGEELPTGWFGKPWACVQGYREARGDLLLFTDADTRHAPELLGRAVGALRSERRDLVTVIGRMICGSFWERVIMPVIGALLAIRFHPTVVNRARTASETIANGQFILVTRESYEAVGTHAAVRHEVAEDLAMAQLYFRAGRPQLFAFALKLMGTRMYTSLAGLVEGWSKNVYVGGKRSFPDEPIRRALLPLMFSFGALFWLLPPVVLLLALGGMAPGWLEPAAWATGLSAMFWVLFNVGFGVNPLYGLSYPLGVVMTGWIFARSTRRGERQIEWRGRTYSTD